MAKTFKHIETTNLNSNNLMKKKVIIMTLTTTMLLFGCTTPDNTPSSPEQQAFEKASDVNWKEVFFDSLTEDWQQQWTLDGEVATAVNTPEGIELRAGPEFKNDAHHMVLWTKESFEGDVKIEYEFTRLDSESTGVNILYIQATGSGEEPYKTDISEWADLRRVPSMKLYFNYMNTYHISYAAFPNPDDVTDDYIRARRYMPHKTGLRGTDLAPDYIHNGFFATGVPHKMTVIKQDKNLYMRISNAEKTRYFHWHNDKLPAIETGRIGLRLMFTRASKFKDFRVSTPE
ncbi:DUF1961 family protein [Opitutales bacterium]|nr:DUF1961 family protein [Opitutales bacterium]MDB2310689.1 DUF1961 family protein [Opitutales bacterium]